MYEIGKPEIQALTKMIRAIERGQSFFRYGGVEAEKFEKAWQWADVDLESSRM